VLLGLFATAGAADDKPNVLKVDGQFAISAPEGFAWKQTGDSLAGREASQFVASKEGAKGRIFLAVAPMVIEGDDKRLSNIKSYHKGIVAGVPAMGMTLVNADIPSFAPPIPARVDIPIVMKNSDGDTVVVHAILVFGAKSTFYLQVADFPGAEEDALVKATESLAE